MAIIIWSGQHDTHTESISVSVCMHLHRFLCMKVERGMWVISTQVHKASVSSLSLSFFFLRITIAMSSLTLSS